MAILGAHMLFSTSEAEELRAMLRDVFGFKCVASGEGWLIFALPPAELGVHRRMARTATRRGGKALDFVYVRRPCRHDGATPERGVKFDGPPGERGFGTIAMMTLPGAVKVMLYEPRHRTARGERRRSSKLKL